MGWGEPQGDDTISLLRRDLRRAEYERDDARRNEQRANGRLQTMREEVARLRLAAAGFVQMEGEFRVQQGAEVTTGPVPDGWSTADAMVLDDIGVGRPARVTDYTGTGRPMRPNPGIPERKGAPLPRDPGMPEAGAPPRFALALLTVGTLIMVGLFVTLALTS